MATWVETAPAFVLGHYCSKHKGRRAVAVEMREGKEGKPPVPVRYLCPVCFVEKHPGIADHGGD